jgi:transcriptional regulator with XRE-family HTH domain
MDLVLKLRELRRLRGLTQQEVGERTGVGEKTLSSFETGERIDSLKLAQLRKLLALYGVTEEDFFSRKLEQLLDPDTVQEPSRTAALMAALDELPTGIRDALMERFELMLHAAQLAAAGPPDRRSTPSVPPITRPAALFRVHAPAA